MIGGFNNSDFDRQNITLPNLRALQYTFYLCFELLFLHLWQHLSLFAFIIIIIRFLNENDEY